MKVLVGAGEHTLEPSNLVCCLDWGSEYTSARLPGQRWLRHGPSRPLLAKVSSRHLKTGKQSRVTFLFFLENEMDAGAFTSHLGRRQGGVGQQVGQQGSSSEDLCLLPPKLPWSLPCS